jgi:hypothetical protein
MKILVIPDTQVAPGSDTRHLKWAGKYAAEKKPDIIVHIGDHWDMPSLSIYDVGKKSFEGRQYTKDIEAGNVGMDEFMAPIIKSAKLRLRCGSLSYTSLWVTMKSGSQEQLMLTGSSKV